MSFAIANLLQDYPSDNTSSSSALGTATATASSTASPETYFSGFNSAGYAEIVVNSSYIGGVVRQWGNLSFSRIYDAGHMVPYYQPESVFTLFARVVEGTDLSTGESINSSDFSSSGPKNATHTNSASTAASPLCWIRGIDDTCSSSEIDSISAGKGVVEYGVWYESAGDYTAPSSTVTAGVPGTPISSKSLVTATDTSGTSSTTPTYVPPIGVYTATSTPIPSSRGSTQRVVLDGTALLGMLIVGVGAMSILF